MTRRGSAFEVVALATYVKGQGYAPAGEVVEWQTRMLQAHVPSMGVRVQIPFSAWYFEQHYHLKSNNA